jgi:hypothetical protein
MGSWYQPRTHGVPRQGDMPIWSSGLWRATANPRPEPGMSYPQGVAVLPGGAVLPAPSGPHQQGTPPWEFPGSKQGPAWVPGQRRRDDPQAVLDRLVCGEADARVSSPSIEQEQD